MTAPDLAPCPFCGGDKVAVCQSERTDPVFWVECIRCNAEAQPSTDKAEAIAAWNTRATPTPDAAEAKVLEGVNGPHEWGYRDPVTGDFVADDAPFRAADLITDLLTTNAALRAGGDA